jgi:hypothetical protein
MDFSQIEQIAYKVGANAVANLAMEKFKIDDIIIGNATSPEMITLRSSAYLFAAEEIGSMGIQIATGGTPPRLADVLSGSTLQAFIGSTIAFYIMNTTDLSRQIQRMAGNNEYARVIAQAFIYEMAGQLAQVVAPMVMNLY